MMELRDGGAVGVFEETGGTWSQAAMVTSWGISTRPLRWAVSGGVCGLAAAPSRDAGGPDTGVVYRIGLRGAVWSAFPQ
jgi:hypothetical protein